MSHLGARILAVLREDRPYELRNTHDEPISKEGAMELIQAEFKVPEETRQARRRRKTNQGRGVEHKRQQLELLSLDLLLYPPHVQFTQPRNDNQYLVKCLTSIRKSQCLVRDLQY